MSPTGRGSERPAVVSYFLGTGTLSSRACTSEESRWQRSQSPIACLECALGPDNGLSGIIWVQ